LESEEADRRTIETMSFIKDDAIPDEGSCEKSVVEKIFIAYDMDLWDVFTLSFVFDTP
jgi:hypothetical protein